MNIQDVRGEKRPKRAKGNPEQHDTQSMFLEFALEPEQQSISTNYTQSLNLKETAHSEFQAHEGKANAEPTEDVAVEKAESGSAPEATSAQAVSDNRNVSRPKTFRGLSFQVPERRLVRIGSIDFHPLLPGLYNGTAYKGDEKFELSEIEEAEAWLFLMAMFWTSSDPERVAALAVAKSKNHLHGEPLAIVIPNGFGSDSTIRVRVPFPSYRTVQAPAPGSDCVRTEYVFLDDWCLGRLVALYRRIRKLTGDRYRLFTGSIEQYKERARTLLRAWDPEDRLTLNKISWVLFGRVMELTGNDAVVATMITGLKHRLSHTAMYYACRELSVIQDIHRKTISCLRRDLDDARSISAQDGFLERVSKMGSASSEVLTFEGVELLSFCHEEATEAVDG